MGNFHPFVRKLTDYILLNAYSVRSAGLYDGKSGMALCLFEVARYLDNEELADKAFELLQESLAFVNKSRNISFGNGLSGIGFVLLYLIENQFIDADFEELFGESFRLIQSETEKNNAYSEKNLPILHFWKLIACSQNSPEYSILINNVLNSTNKSMEKHIEEFASVRSKIVKINVLDIFDYCLKMNLLCENQGTLAPLIEKYIRLFRQGKIACRFSTGYYLTQIAGNLQCPDINFIAQTIKENAIQNIYPAFLTLPQRINLLYFLNQDEVLYQEQINRLEKDLLDTGEPLYEKKIIKMILPSRLIAGYGSGIARLLLYLVYRNNKRSNLDCSRFKYMF
jgi:hypothetical protein